MCKGRAPGPGTENPTGKTSLLSWPQEKRPTAKASALTMSAKVQPLEMGKAVRKQERLSKTLSSFKARLARSIFEAPDPDSLSHIALDANQDRSRLPDRKQVDELERLFCALDNNAWLTRFALNLDPSYPLFSVPKRKAFMYVSVQAGMLVTSVLIAYRGTAFNELFGPGAFVVRAMAASMFLLNTVMFHIIFQALQKSPHWFYHVMSACNRIRDAKTDTWVFCSIQRYLKTFRVLLMIVSIILGITFLGFGIILARYDTFIGSFFIVYAIYGWFSGIQASVFQYWLMLCLNLLLLILETRVRDFMVELQTLDKLEYHQQVQSETSYSPQVGQSLDFAATVRKHKELRAETKEVCKCLEGPLLMALFFSTAIQLGTLVMVFSASTTSSVYDFIPAILLIFCSQFAFLPCLLLLKKLTAITKLHKDIVQYSSDLYFNNDEYAWSEIKFKMYMRGFTPGVVLYGTVLDDKLVARIVYLFVSSSMIVAYRVISIIEK